MTVAKQKTVNPQVEPDDPDDAPVTTLEALGLGEPEVVVGEPEQVQASPQQGEPTFRIRVNRDIENMSYVGGGAAEHYTFEQGHVYDNVPWHIVEELERIGAVWH
jgi:hypothetical protein